LTSINVRVVAYETVNCVKIVEEWNDFGNKMLNFWVCIKEEIFFTK
jgi:hypothetical protein